MTYVLRVLGECGTSAWVMLGFLALGLGVRDPAVSRVFGVVTLVLVAATVVSGFVGRELIRRKAERGTHEPGWEAVWAETCAESDRCPVVGFVACGASLVLGVVAVFGGRRRVEGR